MGVCLCVCACKFVHLRICRCAYLRQGNLKPPKGSNMCPRRAAELSLIMRLSKQEFHVAWRGPEGPCWAMTPPNGHPAFPRSVVQVLGLSHGRVWEPLVPRRHEVMEKSWRCSACRHQVFFGLRVNTPGEHVVVHLKKAAAAFGRRRLF